MQCSKRYQKTIANEEADTDKPIITAGSNKRCWHWNWLGTDPKDAEISGLSVTLVNQVYTAMIKNDSVNLLQILCCSPLPYHRCTVKDVCVVRRWCSWIGKEGIKAWEKAAGFCSVVYIGFLTQSFAAIFLEPCLCLMRGRGLHSWKEANLLLELLISLNNVPLPHVNSEEQHEGGPSYVS